MRSDVPAGVLSRKVPAPVIVTMPLEPAASPMWTFSVTLIRAPPEAVKLAVWPAAAPSCRPAPVGAVRARVPPVAKVEPAWRLSVFRLPPPARVNDPADVLIRSFVPPLTASLNVKLPVPVPVTVVVAARVAEGETTMPPAPATVIVGLVPVKRSGLPARVTVPAVLLTVRALRSKRVPVVPISLVAVYVADCVPAVPKISAVIAPGVGAVPPCQFEPTDQLPPAGLFQVD